MSILKKLKAATAIFLSTMLIVFTVNVSHADNFTISKEEISSKLPILKQLEMALQQNDQQLLKDIEKQVYSLWKQDHYKSNVQQKLGERIIVLLQVLEQIEKYINWQLNHSLPIETTLRPPIDYDVMQYLNGFGVSQIKDPVLKAKVKKDLARVRQALKHKHLQRQLLIIYDNLLKTYVYSLSNDFSTAKDGSDNKHLHSLIKKNLSSSQFKDCVIHLTSIFYKYDIHEVERKLNIYKGNCKHILDSR